MRSALPLALVLLVFLVTGCPGLNGRVPEKDKVDLGIQLRNHTFSLANGLVVVMHRDSTARSTYVEVAYDVGAKDDPPGRAGLAHLFEHLLFGPVRHEARDAGELLDEVGAEFNASTSYDDTRYHEAFAPAVLPRVLWLEAERMAYPAARVDDATLAREREVVVNEWRERYENEPYGNLLLTTYAELFGPEHPYHRPPIGTPEDLARITLGDVRAFALAHYRPNRATLVVSGNFDPTVTRQLVERYFATIPPGQTPMPRKAEVALRKSRTVTLEADVSAPRVVLAWPAPGIDADGLEELQLGLDLLDGWATSALVIDRKLATRVTSSLMPRRLGSMAMVDATATEATSPEALASAIEEEIARTAGASEHALFEGFGDVKTRMMVESVRDLEGLEGRADAFLHGVRFHRTADTVQDHLRRIQRVTFTDAGGAVRQLLADAPHLTVLVRPTKGAPRAGRVVR